MRKELSVGVGVGWVGGLVGVDGMDLTAKQRSWT